MNNPRRQTRPIQGHELSWSDHCLQWNKLPTLVYSTVDTRQWSNYNIYNPTQSSSDRLSSISTYRVQTVSTGREDMWPAGLCCCGGQMCRIQRQKKAITDTRPWSIHLVAVAAPSPPPSVNCCGRRSRQGASPPHHSCIIDSRRA